MENNKLLTVFAIVSFLFYAAIGYGAARLFQQPLPRKIAAAVAVPVLSYLWCWWSDLHDTGPHGFIHFSARDLWLLPAIFVLRFFSGH